MNQTPTIKYINPMVDDGFKRIFKESGKKQLIIRPLNAIFGLDIVDLDIRESEQQGLVREAHRAFYDLFCQSSDGKRFIVEVQLADQRHFLERALFYTSLPIAKSMPHPTADKKKRKKLKSRRVRWDYNYPPVFFLGLLNFDLPHLVPDKSNPQEYIHLFSLRDESTGELMTDRLRFAFMEVARFDKHQDECHTFEDKFLFIMKNLHTFAVEPVLWDDDPYFKDFIQEAEFANMTDRQQERYLAKMKGIWDYENTIDYAKEKAAAEAEKRGEARGEAKGYVKGIADGEARGDQKRAEATARKMLANGYPVSEIAELTDLSEEQIRAL